MEVFRTFLRKKKQEQWRKIRFRCTEKLYQCLTSDKNIFWVNDQMQMHLLSLSITSELKSKFLFMSQPKNKFLTIILTLQPGFYLYLAFRVAVQQLAWKLSKNFHENLFDGVCTASNFIKKLRLPHTLSASLEYYSMH